MFIALIAHVITVLSISSILINFFFQIPCREISIQTFLNVSPFPAGRGQQMVITGSL